MSSVTPGRPIWDRPASPPFDVVDGTLPVVVHVPHAGLAIPPDVRADLRLDDDQLADELRRITDHRTDVLASAAVELGAFAFVNRISRLVVDPERFPDPDREEMAQVGMGAVYTATTGLAPLRAVDPTRRAQLMASWFHPYADALTDLVADVVDRFGRCAILDLHSYPRNRLDYERGRTHRPQVCIGVDPQHTPDHVAAAIERLATTRGIDTARNTPFAGTYVPLRWYGTPGPVTSVMLEVRRDLYLDEATWEPTAGEAPLAQFVAHVVAAMAGLDLPA